MSPSSSSKPERTPYKGLTPASILDTDLYKITMQNAVFQKFHGSQSEYKFTNRAPEMLFTRKTFDWVVQQVAELKNLHLTPPERTFLQSSCPYLSSPYLDFLESLQLDPDNQVEVTFHPQVKSTFSDGEGKEVDGADGANGGAGEEIEEMGLIQMKIRGPWRECILYEVPLMAILSESYFLHTSPPSPRTWDPSPPLIRSLARAKAKKLLTDSGGKLAFSEFGTRRRRSYKVHREVMEGLVEGDGEFRRENEVVRGGLVGTSNVHLAMVFGIKPVGTIAHEWIMAIGAKENYQDPNGRAMDLWEEVYPASTASPLHTMLTDTYTAPLFFREFTSSPSRALRWNGLRHDSGDPIEFARAVRKAWEVVAKESGVGSGVEEVLRGKRVIFSDGLDVERALEIWGACEEIGVDASFGIGTHFTNDFHHPSDPSIKSKPLNIVIKLRKIDGLECVKLSDDHGKWTGDRGEVERCRQILGLNGEGKGEEEGKAYGLDG